MPKYQEIDRFMRQSGFETEPAFERLNILNTPIPDKKILGLYYPSGDVNDPDFGYLPPSTSVLPEDSDFQTVLHELGHCYNWHYNQNLSEESAERWRLSHQYLLNGFATRKAIGMVARTKEEFICQECNSGIDYDPSESMINCQQCGAKYYRDVIRAAAGMSIIVSPNTIEQGGKVNINISGYAAGTPLIIGVVGGGYITATTNSSGSVTTSFTDNDPPGTYTLYAYDSRTGYGYITTEFNITSGQVSSVIASISDIRIKYNGNYVSAVPPGGMFDLEFAVKTSISYAMNHSVGVTMLDFSKGTLTQYDSGAQQENKKYAGTEVWSFKNLIMPQNTTTIILSLWVSAQGGQFASSTLTSLGPPTGATDWLPITSYEVNIALGRYIIPSDYTPNLQTFVDLSYSGTVNYTVLQTSIPLGSTPVADWITGGDLPLSLTNKVIADIGNKGGQVISVNIYSRKSGFVGMDKDYLIEIWTASISGTTLRAALGPLAFIAIVIICATIITALALVLANAKQLISTTTTVQPHESGVDPGKQETVGSGNSGVAEDNGGGGTTIRHPDGTTVTLGSGDSATVQPGDVVTGGSTGATIHYAGTTTTTNKQTGTDWVQIAKYTAIALSILGGTLVISNVISAFKKT